MQKSYRGQVIHIDVKNQEWRLSNMEWWILALLKIMLINIILSGDNAIIIAMASRKLPKKQRRLAIFWGAFGAVALRIILTIVAIQLLKVPYLMAIGSLLLVWIAVKLLINEEDHSNIHASSSLKKVILTIVLADFIMSLDNVLAIAAIAKGSLLLITIGIIISIPLIIWGSVYITRLLNKYPMFIYLGSAILGFTAGEMLIRDPAIIHFFVGTNHLIHVTLPICTALAVLIISSIFKANKFNLR